MERGRIQVGAVHTVFMDNLPVTVTKRELYKLFGRDGYVYDIFVSRKKRWSINSPFAFVRYQGYENAMSACKRLNGVEWRGAKLAISLSIYKREQNDKRKMHGVVNVRKQEQKVVKKWVAIRKTRHEGDGNGGNKLAMEAVKLSGKNEVEVIWSVK
ncbi:hypothetical protein PIB30_008428 [Stylosanthes scabra]|uniref:RRM domain-containing protein n=1 Tax=Stylosanthes scabra TaxID=79078 RepID=A0ABU6W4G7_9FABA|nr:hypothetical protein [Stylosanthes scabra]